MIRTQDWEEGKLPRPGAIVEDPFLGAVQSHHLSCAGRARVCVIEEQFSCLSSLCHLSKVSKSALGYLV